MSGPRMPAPQAKLLEAVGRHEDLDIKVRSRVAKPKQFEANLRAAGFGVSARHVAPRLPDVGIAGWPLKLSGCVDEHSTSGDEGKYSHGPSALQTKCSEMPFRHATSDL